MRVSPDGVTASSYHCIVVSTLPEPSRPFGKLIDNFGGGKPMILEEADSGARGAFKKPSAQRNGPMVHGVELTDAYEFVQRPLPS